MTRLDATLLEDCARNLRIQYRLPVPVSEALLRATGADRVIVTPFSSFVAGSRDHLRAFYDGGGGGADSPVADSPRAGSPVAGVRAEAADGSTTLVVTFGSLHSRARPEAVMAFESALTTALTPHRNL